MSLISFAWTTPPLLAGAKPFTWRTWNPRYAQQFIDRAACAEPHCIVDATDKSMRNGGIKIAKIKLVSVTRRSISELTDEDYEAEGLGWLARHPEACPKRMWGKSFDPYFVSREHFDERRRSGEVGYDIRMELLEVLVANPWAGLA